MDIHHLQNVINQKDFADLVALRSQTPALSHNNHITATLCKCKQEIDWAVF